MFRTVWGVLRPAPCRVKVKRLITLVLLAPLVALAQPSSDPVKQLAAKILAQVHSPVSLTFENRSTLAAADVDAIRTSLEEQLRAGGLALGDSETKLRVTLREDPARYLLIPQSR